MHLKVSYEDGPHDVTVLRVADDGQGGALDAASAAELRSVLREVIEGGRLVLVVDLSAVHGSLDRAGLSVLFEGLRRVHYQGGTLTLVVTTRQVRDFLAGTRLHGVFRTYETVASAVAELAADYAETSVEQRRAAVAEQASHIVAPGDHSYEHVSEYVTVVTLTGDVDVYTAPFVRQLLVDLINHGRLFLVLEMTTVTYLDSTGFGVVVGGLKRVRSHDGAMALVVPEERIRKVFRITGLTKVFPIFDTVGPAVEFLGREVPGV